MILKNCTYKEITEIFNRKRLIIFGVGDYFKYYVVEHLPNEVRGQVWHFVDNDPTITSISAWGLEYEVNRLESLRDEKNCIVLIASSNHMLDMYEQLDKLGLPDSVECYSFGLIMAASCGEEDVAIKKIFTDISRKERIPRKIHTFWFSGDEKPKEYQKCIDSWHRFCSDYEIIEWNCDNYNY